ncbi:SDR family oxidoreductase, partial [Candidatus Saccharibacteria bacterium]|nr:SDR family oxidoreductase [Candidatus Saccharibacteria bacterium]
GLTKRAINSLTEALSYKYYKNNIRINAIAPGVTATEMTNIDPKLDLFSDSISGRFFVPEEVAEVALFLLSDNSKCISGQIIHTNGGNHIKRRY